MPIGIIILFVARLDFGPGQRAHKSATRANK